MSRKPKPVQLSCRPFDEDEWEVARDLRLLSLADSPGNFTSTLAREEALPDTHWQDAVTDKDGTVFAIFAGHEAVARIGIVQSAEDASRAVIWGTFVKAEWRGRGLTRPLYATAIAYAKARGWREIVVSHRADNVASQAATLAHDFVFTHEAVKKWPDGIEAGELFYVLRVQA